MVASCVGDHTSIVNDECLHVKYVHGYVWTILDEVGELTHELKANWCWWKKTQPPVDEKKVLGELVDIWHFVLSWQNNFNGGEEGLLTD
jgi:dimeric dUTPase (all-alpha-NTP-PPase superfamily)